MFVIWEVVDIVVVVVVVVDVAVLVVVVCTGGVITSDMLGGPVRRGV